MKLVLYSAFIQKPAIFEVLRPFVDLPKEITQIKFVKSDSIEFQKLLEISGLSMKVLLLSSQKLCSCIFDQLAFPLFFNNFCPFRILLILVFGRFHGHRIPLLVIFN